MNRSFVLKLKLFYEKSMQPSKPDKSSTQNPRIQSINWENDLNSLVKSVQKAKEKAINGNRFDIILLLFHLIYSMFIMLMQNRKVLSRL